jgi:hypothetical protein
MIELDVHFPKIVFEKNSRHSKSSKMIGGLLLWIVRNIQTRPYNIWTRVGKQIRKLSFRTLSPVYCYFISYFSFLYHCLSLLTTVQIYVWSASFPSFNLQNRRTFPTVILYSLPECVPCSSLLLFVTPRSRFLILSSSILRFVFCLLHPFFIYMS